MMIRENLVAWGVAGGKRGKWESSVCQSSGAERLEHPWHPSSLHGDQVLLRYILDRPLRYSGSQNRGEHTRMCARTWLPMFVCYETLPHHLLALQSYIR
jgi:hypothetical protein